jgi:transposase
MAKKRRKMDRKLAAKLQKHEVAYIAKKFGVSAASVRRVIARVGHSRRKVYEFLKTPSRLLD